MALKTISKAVDIEAPAQDVWDVLFSDDTYRVWSEAFSPGSYADTDWRTDSQIQFLDQTGNGLLATVVESNPPNLMSIRFLGAVSGGKPDYDSDEAREFKDAKEIYRLNEASGITRLEIAADMADQYYNDMSDSWDKALRKVKQLAELR